MTSTKTYYFTTALTTIFTERQVQGVGSQPAYDDIVIFDDFWNVIYNNQHFFKYKLKFLGYEWTGFRWFI
jgi:hypothetical protein